MHHGHSVSHLMHISLLTLFTALYSIARSALVITQLGPSMRLSEIGEAQYNDDSQLCQTPFLFLFFKIT